MCSYFLILLVLLFSYTVYSFINTVFVFLDPFVFSCSLFKLSTKQPTCKAEDLRLKARDTLTASVTNGRLDDIIKDKEILQVLEVEMVKFMEKDADISLLDSSH